jgi:regulator of protease activity HflC (stomatin/prohibitin superfamily)
MTTQGKGIGGSKWTIKRIILVAVVVIAGIFLLTSLPRIMEDVQGGEVHVKQAWISGNMSVHVKEGMYFQKFGTITKYYRTFDTFLSNDVLDGGKGAETNATEVMFGGGGKADVGSVTQWRIPLTEEAVIKIHRNFRTFDGLKSQVRQWIIEVEKQTASTFKAEETYSTRRGEFSQLITDQIINGLYQTEVVETEEPTGDIDENGSPIMTKTLKTRVKRDDNGNPIIVKRGIFQEYDIELVNHTLKDINYDETVDLAIERKKATDQERAVARANAEKARQDAITAEEQGKANIALARAAEEVQKITAVTIAQKEKEVAELRADQDKNVATTAAQKELEVAELNKQTETANAEALLITEKAEADANKLKVEAGLSPQQAAEWKYRTTVDSMKAWADGISKFDSPDVYVAGGENGGLDPMNMISVNQALQAVNQMDGSE